VGAYRKFLDSKRIVVRPSGVNIPTAGIHPILFPFQRDIVRWALRLGKACIFADCGLGKTLMQLEWARHIGGKCLILTPLAVAAQTAREAEKIGIKAQVCRSHHDVIDGINISNYERLHKFDPGEFKSIVLDESSILKSFDGKTRNQIITTFGNTPYRLACTATPAPNDHMELGNHAEFLGVMSRTEMLSMFFVHDGGDTSKWRIKGHAEGKFWEWVASWACVLRRPSDLGYDDNGFILPELKIHETIIQSGKASEGMLFAMPAETLQERRGARRASMGDRVAHCVLTVKSEWDKLATSHNGGMRDGLEEGICGREEKEGAGGPGISGETKRAIGERQGEKKEIPEELLQNAPGEVPPKDPRATKNIQREQAKEIRREHRAPHGNTGSGQGVATRKPDSKEGAAHQEVRNNDVRIFIDDDGAGREVRNLRASEHGRSELLSGGGSLPQNKKGERASLYELQHGDREIQGQSDVDEGGRPVYRKPYLIWCDLNSEQDLLRKLFGDSAFSIQGSDTPEHKEDAVNRWLRQERPVMISKPSMLGFGLNFQHCADMIFVGLSDSYEAFYQAVRRCWRFGQQNPVNVHTIIGSQESNVLQNVKRKEADLEKMQEGMVEHTYKIIETHLKSTERAESSYETRTETGDGWEMRLGDCVEEVQTIPADSIHYSLFSPPFASLYTYSDSERDMGNCRQHSEFYEHFKFLAGELYRATMPGRLLSFHCMNLPASKTRDGYIGIHDFRGEMIRIFLDAGWIYHSEVCIWKDPVTAMQRTKALGLLHKQIRKDSTMSRQGIADYLVTMRKHGENPERVSHTPEEFPVSLWQRYASPIWMDINPSRTLQKTSAREEKDERHICPLQLDVIDRAIMLWTNPGDLILSPFAGIGSEGHQALIRGRRFLGIELKESYFRQAVANLTAASSTQGMALFK
jgi:superfamily II DNA or RNA helicase